MNYSKHYSKLNKPDYTTIRRYLKGRKVGDIVPEIVNGKILHYAKIIRIQQKVLTRIPDAILFADTDDTYRPLIYSTFQSFYEKPIDFHKDKFYIFTMKKVLKRASRSVPRRTKLTDFGVK